MARLLFFGRLGEAMGREREMPLPAGVATVGALTDHLCAKDEAFASAFAQGAVNFAVNEEMAARATPVSDADEIAFLPPFSGG